jgi:Cdc6-like AAA superfamily ATPase
MIYPQNFPITEDPNIETNPEKIVYDLLKQQSSAYDIFYSQKFRAETDKERSDYEIDFIVVKPDQAILLIEVKGGQIEYDGIQRRWYQNGKQMTKAPTDQVISCVSSLLKRYPELAKKVPVGWVVCFPQCEIINDTELPTNLSRSSIMDQKDLIDLSSNLNRIIKNTKIEFSYKEGLKDYEYRRLKQQLLRGLGLVQRLSTRIELDERIYIKLTNEQYNIFRQALDNKRLVVNGTAGSGKTIIAKELAKELLDKDDRVLFLCFNRTLATNIRQEFRRQYPDNRNIEVSTFHHFARRQINDDDWFTINKKKRDFWELLIPEKLESIPQEQLKSYDAIIVDEGQDFKEFWYELLERHIKLDGQFLVFLDANQDIFNHYTQLPDQQRFVKFRLDRNCRNPKKVLHYLTAIADLPFKFFENSPIGNCTIKKYKNKTEQIRLIRDDIIQLIEQDGLSPGQIVILIHSDKANSFLADVKKFKKYHVKSAYRPQDVKKNDVMYGTIEIFKGLESDVVLLADTHLIKDAEFKKRIYVEASRAKHSLYVYEKGN